MGSFCNYLENKLLDHILGVSAWTAPATVYIGLSETPPGETGTNWDASVDKKAMASFCLVNCFIIKSDISYPN